MLFTRSLRRYTAPADSSTSMAIKTVNTTVRGRPTFLGIFWMVRDMAGYKSFTHTMPKMPQKKEYIKFVRPPMFKGESLYSHETVPNTACCTKLHRYSKAPPMNMLARKIMMSFWLYMRHSSKVMATAPRPYTGMKGPNTRPTRTWNSWVRTRA